MKKTAKPKVFLAICLAAVVYCCNADAQKPTSWVKIIKLTGTIEIKMGSKTIIIKPGEKMPELDASAKIKVLSGDVQIQAGKTTLIKANNGANFSFALTADGKEIKVKTTGNSSPVELKASASHSIIITADSSINLQSNMTEIKIEVVKGIATLTDAAGKTRTVARGEKITTAITPSVVSKPASSVQVSPIPKAAPKEPATLVGEQKAFVSDYPLVDLNPPPASIIESQQLRETQEIISPSSP